MSDNYQINQNGPYSGGQDPYNQYGQNPGQYGQRQVNQNPGQYGQGQFNQNSGQYNQGQFNQTHGQYGQGQYNQNAGQYTKNPDQFGQNLGQYSQGQYNQPQGQYGQGQYSQPQAPYSQNQFNQPPKKSNAGLIIGIVCGAVVLLLLAVVGLVAILRSVNGHKETASEETVTENLVSDSEDDWDIQGDTGEAKTEEETEASTEEATEEETEEATEETEAATEESDTDLSDAKSTLGKYENGLYTNEFFGLTYTPSATEHVKSEEEIAVVNGASGSFLNMEEGEFEEQLKKNRQIIDMVSSTVKGDSVTIIIQTLDFSPEEVDLKTIFELQKDDMLAALEDSAYTNLNYEVSSDTFLGEDTPCAVVTSEVQGFKLRQEVFYVIKDKYLMIVTATTMTDGGIDDLLSRFSKLD